MSSFTNTEEFCGPHSVLLYSPHFAAHENFLLRSSSPWVIWAKCDVKITCLALLDYPKVKLSTIFKVPEVPKKPVVEEKPAIPVAEKVESPPAEGTHGAIAKLVICDYL